MIKKLYKLGEHIPDKYFEKNSLGLNYKEQPKDTLIYFLCFKTSCKGEYEYKGIYYEEYDLENNKQKKYLYKNAKGNAKSPFMTVFYEKNSLKDNCISLDTKSGKKIIEILKINIKINPKLKGLSKILASKFVSDPLEINNNFILSIKVDGKYLGEWGEYKEIMDSYIKEQFKCFYNKYSNTISKFESACCYICQSKDEVWGFVDTFKFYSANEDSVIAGGFSKNDSWKNYPVCSACARKLEKYKGFLQDYLSFNFYGFNYFLIPEFVFDKKDNKEFINILISERGLLSFKNLYQTNKLEDELVDMLQDSNNNANYTLLFYEENNSEFKIKLSIDDVFPSRFSEIYKARQHAEDNSLFKNIKFKKNESPKGLKMKFGIIKHFFPASKIEGNFSSYFLEIVRSIFIGKKIDYDFVLDRIVSKLRNKFVKDERLSLDVLNVMMLIRFINYLGLWNKKEKIKEREVIMEGNKYTNFLKENEEFFNSNTKKAVFLEGVLCQKLMNWQLRERSSTPFRSKLNGLKLDEKYIKKLLPEIINKLEEYGKNYYKDLESIISKYMLGAKFDMTNDEISFYFVMGMNLAKEFKNEKEIKEEEK